MIFSVYYDKESGSAEYTCNENVTVDAIIQLLTRISTEQKVKAMLQAEREKQAGEANVENAENDIAKKARKEGKPKRSASK